MPKKKHFLAKYQKIKPISDHEDHRFRQSVVQFMKRMFRSRRKPKKIEG